MFGYNLNDEMIYHPLELRTETISSGIGSLVSYAKSKGTNYKTIRMLNPWMRDKFLNNSKGRMYTVLLPRN